MGASPALLGAARAGTQVTDATTPKSMQADVVVVGTGIGGLTAALRALKLRARVIVLEKAAEPGGIGGSAAVRRSMRLRRSPSISKRASGTRNTSRSG
jgi:glycine/D-amino acid oxidase-like deaminating enzyme